jgi:hypothetical protein
VDYASWRVASVPTCHDPTKFQCPEWRSSDRNPETRKAIRLRFVERIGDWHQE